VRIEGVQVTGS